MILREYLAVSEPQELELAWGAVTRCPKCWAYLKYENTASKGFFTVTSVNYKGGKIWNTYDYGFKCPCCGSCHGAQILP